MSKESFIFPQILNHEDYVESWYPLISNFTFKTWIFNFTLDEGNLLLRLIKNKLNKETPTENDQSLFETFLSKVTDFFEIVKKESPPNSGYFLRLGSRSLKDAVLDCNSSLQRMKDMLYQKYLNQYKSLHFTSKSDKINWVNQTSTIDDFAIVAECDTKALKCETLSEMFELFFKSERIHDDLAGEVKCQWPRLSLNFRLWDDRLSYENEFRGFVYHHRLCALSQYDRRLYCKRVYMNKDKILSAIIDLYENKVRPNMQSNCPLPEGAYVIDFGVIFKDDDVDEAIVIEINQFSKLAGASMFNWIDDIDVLTGKKEFEFRLVEENQYDDVNYDQVLYPDLLMVKNEAKAKVVNDNKSFFERYVTWRDDVVPTYE